MTSVSICGTYSAHNRHLRNKEKPCDPCREAANEYQREQRAKNREAKRARDRAYYRRKREAAGLKPAKYIDPMPEATHGGRCGSGENYRAGCPGCHTVKRMRTYNISLDKWRQMVSEQGGACAICGDSARTLHVDHDHACCPGQRSCGKCVRKLLCGPCNRGIGLFKDSPEILAKAAEYLAIGGGFYGMGKSQ